MAVHVVPVEVELLAVEPGKWCTDCALSSGLLVHFVLTVAGRTTVRQTRKCRDCGGSNVVLDD